MTRFLAAVGALTLLAIASLTLYGIAMYREPYATTPGFGVGV